ncbi:RidA family protein [Nocardiopsis oceani]
MSLTRINPPQLHDPTPAGYAHVVTALSGDLVMVAGQVGVEGELTPGGELLDTDFTEQVGGALANLRIALRAAGLDFAAVAQTTSYVVGLDPDRARIVREASRRAWADHLPAHSLIGVAALGAPQVLFEIEAIAARS